MKRISVALVIAAAMMAGTAHAQFTVPAKGVQTFNVKDERGRNQASFSSKAPLEDITGTSAGLAGTVSLDPANVAKTIKADITVDVASIKTGIDMRDEHLRGESWLNAAKYPKIQFVLRSVKNVKPGANNTIDLVAVGDWSMRGVTQPAELKVSLTYMPESDKTKMRAPGDLLVVRAKGSVQLTKFGISQPQVIGSKMNDVVDFEFNAVGSNAVK